MTRRVRTKRTVYKPLPRNRSGVIAGQRLSRGCHWVSDELPS